MTKSTAGNALRTVQAYARGEVAHWSVSLGLRDATHDMLKRATGASVEYVDGMNTVLLDGRTAYTRYGGVPKELVPVAGRNLAEWLRGQTDVPAGLLPPTVPARSSTLLERMGLNPLNAFGIARVLHQLRYGDGTRSVSLTDDRQGRKLHYANGAVHWRNGIITVRRLTLPPTLAMGLAGRPVGDIIDDPMFEGIEMRYVASNQRPDQVLQIITRDAGIDVATTTGEDQ